MMRIFAVLFLLSAAMVSSGQHPWLPPSSNPVELGLVKWSRDYNQAILQSKITGKPLFILFQEVPGCSTCTSYGKEVLSHPLIVEAIEQFFVPLCIHNNRPGEDARVLKLFKEPAWNNPVVRITDAKGKDLVQRLASAYSPGYLVHGITAALRKQRIAVPGYLEILDTEMSNEIPQEIILGMYCFWTGEKTMAAIAGVTETEAGYMGGKEVVRVTFNPDIISAEQLAEQARKQQCADVIFDNKNRFDHIRTQNRSTYRKDSENKYYLYNSGYRSLPMTPLQQLKANAEIAAGGDVTYILSPRQEELFEFIGKQHSMSNRIGEDITEAWLSVLRIIPGR